jgi:hypothetical protein
MTRAVAKIMVLRVLRLEVWLARDQYFEAYLYADTNLPACWCPSQEGHGFNFHCHEKLTFTYLLTHSLTLWSLALLDGPPVVQPLSSFPSFYRT